MGTGASTGGVDLPLAREPSTGWPVVPGSGLKGVLRGALGLSEATVNWLFGPPWKAQDRDQGALMFSDLRLLCLPVRSYSGGWAWVTSPAALAAYRGEARWCLPAAAQLPAVPAAPGDQECVCASASSPLKAGNAVYLHDLRFEAPASAPQAGVLDQWAEHLAPRIFGGTEAAACAMFTARLLLVSETALAYLGEVAMDVRTRVRLEARKAAAASGPWVEESLPVETVLWGSVAADAIQKADNDQRSAEQAIDAFARAVGTERRLQLGGQATVGRGVVRFVNAAA